MTTLTASSAKAKLLGLLRKAHDFGEKYTITHNGQACAVLLSNEEYEGLLETVEILADKNLTAELARAIADVDQGKTLSFEEVAGRKQKK